MHNSKTVIGIPLSTLAQDVVSVNFEERILDMRRFFHLLSDKNRLKIIQLLHINQEMHVSALCDALQESQPATSHHLSILRTAGMIEPRRDGKHNYYSLVPESLAWNGVKDFLNMINIPLPIATSTPQEIPQS